MNYTLLTVNNNNAIQCLYIYMMLKPYVYHSSYPIHMCELLGCNLLAWTPGNLETWKPEDWVAKLGEFLVAPPTNKYK